MLEETLMCPRFISPTDRKKPDAIRYHIIDIYFEELNKVLNLQREQGEEIHLSNEDIERPLRVTVAENTNKVARKRAKEALRFWEQENKSRDEEMEE